MGYLGRCVDPRPTRQPSSFKDQIVYPWTTADNRVFACRRAARHRRARSCRRSRWSSRQTLRRARPPTTRQSACRATCNACSDRSSSGARAPPHRGAGPQARAVRVVRADTDRLPRARSDAVVLNAPPLHGRRLVHSLPHGADLAGLLEHVRVLRLAHPDPHRPGLRSEAIAPTGRPTTPASKGRQCEGSVWYGALRPKLPSGQTVDVFKSWAERRRVEPKHILLQRRFKHPHITRSTIKGCPRVASAPRTERPVLQRPVHDRL